MGCGLGWVVRGEPSGELFVSEGRVREDNITSSGGAALTEELQAAVAMLTYLRIDVFDNKDKV